MNVRYVALPVAGACLGVGMGMGVVELFGEDETYAAQMAAVEDCQYDLEDTPQHVTELSADCERYEDYFAYNYQTDTYYVPAAGELPDYLPIETDTEITDDMAKFRLVCGGLFGIWGLWAGYSVAETWKQHDEKKLENSFPEPQLEQ